MSAGTIKLYCIYRVDGPDGVYFGQTEHSAHRRWVHHQTVARRGGRGRLAQAIRQHGVDRFVVTELQRVRCTLFDATCIEHKLIASACRAGLCPYNDVRYACPGADGAEYRAIACTDCGRITPPRRRRGFVYREDLARKRAERQAQEAAR